MESNVITVNICQNVYCNFMWYNAMLSNLSLWLECEQGFFTLTGSQGVLAVFKLMQRNVMQYNVMFNNLMECNKITLN